MEGRGGVWFGACVPNKGSGAIPARVLTGSPQTAGCPSATPTLRSVSIPPPKQSHRFKTVSLPPAPTAVPRAISRTAVGGVGGLVWLHQACQQNVPRLRPRGSHSAGFTRHLYKGQWETYLVINSFHSTSRGETLTGTPG